MQVMQKTCVFFRENFYNWHKFYTTAGRDSPHKSQLCSCPPFLNYSLFFCWKSSDLATLVNCPCIDDLFIYHIGFLHAQKNRKLFVKNWKWNGLKTDDINKFWWNFQNEKRQDDKCIFHPWIKYMENDVLYSSCRDPRQYCSWQLRPKEWVHNAILHIFNFQS